MGPSPSSATTRAHWSDPGTRRIQDLDALAPALPPSPASVQGSSPPRIYRGRSKACGPTKIATTSSGISPPSSVRRLTLRPTLVKAPSIATTLGVISNHLPVPSGCAFSPREGDCGGGADLCCGKTICSSESSVLRYCGGTSSGERYLPGAFGVRGRRIRTIPGSGLPRVTLSTRSLSTTHPPRVKSRSKSPATRHASSSAVGQPIHTFSLGSGAASRAATKDARSCFVSARRGEGA